MKSIDHIFKTDEKVEQETGIPINYGEFRVHIVRAGGSNKKYTRLLQQRLKPYRRQLENESMDDDVAAKILAETYADSIIIKMEVKDGEGKWKPGILRSTGVVPFSRENVVKVLLEVPEFFNDLKSQAGQVALFRAFDLDDDAKN